MYSFPFFALNALRTCSKYFVYKGRAGNEPTFRYIVLKILKKNMYVKTIIRGEAARQISTTQHYSPPLWWIIVNYRAIRNVDMETILNRTFLSTSDSEHVTK